MAANAHGRLTTGEWAVLGLLAEHPSHGLALTKELSPHGTVGRSGRCARRSSTVPGPR
ncbi:MAG TPA: hypothetical protein VFA92_02880 [Candidatus Binatia bacterium]|nr:hypothetical protein [Candidatus Binatia bacterium]